MQLREHDDVGLVDEPDVDERTVVVAVVDRLDEDACRALKRLRQRCGPPVVLVVGDLDDAGLLCAVEAGVSAVVRRTEATGAALRDAVVSVAVGNGSLPPDLLGRLLANVSRLQREVLTPSGLNHAGFTDREVVVLRFVAEGLDTGEIAEKLSYSERTIKSILHDVTTRLRLRNRTHAVAFAMREGLL